MNVLRASRKVVSAIFTLVGVGFMIYLPTKYLRWIEFEPRPAVAVADTDAFARSADEYWSQAAKNGELKGHLRIQKGGKVVLSKSYGDTSANEKTEYLIGSLSKQFTSALVLDLVASGKLKLDDPVCKYVSHFCADKLKAITVDELMTHTSGLPRLPISVSGILAIFGQFFFEYDLQEFVSLHSPSVVDSAPGEKCSYSNYGFDVLAAVAENAGDQKFADAMDRFLRDRAKLASTSMAKTGVYRNFFGSGAIVSSPADMSAWGNELLSYAVLSEETRRIYWEPRFKKCARGWMIFKHAVSDEKIVWHNGKVPGYYSTMAIYPESQTVVVWLSDSDLSSKEEMQIPSEFDDLLMGDPYSVPSGRRTIPGFKL